MKLHAPIVFLAITATSCATILQPGPDRISVDSNPRGATVFVDGSAVGQTPMVVNCERSSECVIKIEKDGFQSISIDKDKVVAGWFLAGIFLGPISWVVDLIGHNQGKYQTDPVSGTLTPMASAAKTN